MSVLAEGCGPLFQVPDPDGLRAFFAAKDRSMIDKRVTAKEAVERFIPDGCYLAVGGFGTNRIPTEVLHEILRARRRDLGFLGHTATHDFELLCAGDCLDRVDAAYIVGLEARGLSTVARRLMQSGRVQVCEWTNYALSVRLRAAADGVPFGVLRSMLGTDTFGRSAAKTMACPFTGQKVAAVPACSPDVAVIHVHEADAYGNARIRGITVADSELVRAAKRVIVTTERLVETASIREQPEATFIPFYLVDAVVLSPYGSYPGNMPYEYFSDEDHLAAWLKAEKDPAAFAAFMDKHIYGVSDFREYLELCGGAARLAALRAEERMEIGGGAA
ncbi:CoA transferase subunit A [Shumkonia mesophila]|uniref:CoA transferase subunit A n=1 Tax=Shumkonia mesophila TaxID=2838854 RepID=UPI00293490E6|nr:CoA-transferase [Shumkonia mesophila]